MKLKSYFYTTAIVFTSILIPSIGRADITPAFDLTGTWISGTSGTQTISQTGTQIIVTAINASFAHYIVGRYTSPTMWEGIIQRTNRSTGCTTEMRVVNTVLDNDHVTGTSTALDSNCDLQTGAQFSDNITRTQ